MYSAHTMLAKHNESNEAPAILGWPSPELVSDIKSQQAELFHVLSGEMLAQASLQTEILVCAVANVPHSKYIGRSQHPRIVNKPARRKHALDDKFTCPAANFWGMVEHLLKDYIRIRADCAAECVCGSHHRGSMARTRL